MLRHRREDVYFEPAAAIDPADRAEQQQPTDPIELAHEAEQAGLDARLPDEADPVDAADQARPVAVDDELRAEAVGVAADVVDDAE